MDAGHDTSTGPRYLNIPPNTWESKLTLGPRQFNFIIQRRRSSNLKNPRKQKLDHGLSGGDSVFAK
jgi:hypothetical protein